MSSADIATIEALRRDLALQIARHLRRGWASQMAAAKSLGIPQPTLSRIATGQVSELSLELLIRVAVRARLPLVLQTGKEPAEAGVFAGAQLPERSQNSKLADRARLATAAAAAGLTPEQRLMAQLRHSELLTALRQAGRTRRAGDVPHAGKVPR